MVCDRCDGCRESGMNFCPYCGDDLKGCCTNCGAPRSAGHSLCPECERANVPNDVGILRKIAGVAFPVVLILLVIELIAMISGLFTVWDWLDTVEVNVLALVPQLIVVTTITGLPSQLLWAFIFISIVLSAIVLVIQSVRSFKSAREAMGVGESIERTEMYDTFTLFVTMTFMSLAFSLILTLIGGGVDVPEDLPTGTDAESLYSFANAAVWEEWITRVVYIGIPMAIAGLALTRDKGSLKMIFGGFGMSKLALALIVISALVFGFGHAGDWGFWKVVPSFVAGLIMGYAYVKIGLHASIIIHFLTDYMSVSLEPSIMLITTPVIFVVIGLGPVCAGLMAKRMFDGRDKLRTLPNWLADQPNRDSNLEED